MEFLQAIDLILSTVNEQDKSHKTDETVFCGAECQRLALMTQKKRKSHLSKLVDMLSAKHLVESTDEELLDVEYSWPPSPSPPPVPPRNESIGQDATSPPVPKRNARRLRGSSSSGPSEQASAPVASASTSGEHLATPLSELDSDSDFEAFIPPVRRQCSDFELFTPPVRPKKRQHRSRLASNRANRANSFSVATYQAKMKVMGRSRSLDAIAPCPFTKAVDPDDAIDYTGASAGYSTFEHINAWRKALTKDSSFITGSLPELENENDLEDSYIDPNEITAVVFDTGTKLGTHASTRLHSRALSLASYSGDNPYLTLVNGAFETAASPASVAVDGISPITPYTSIDGVLRKTFTFPETLSSIPSRSVTPSGYQSDASSDADEGLQQQDAKRSSLYAHIPGDSPHVAIENVAYGRSRSGRMPSKGSGLYASIEELDHPLHQQQLGSSLVPNGVERKETRLRFSPSQGLMQYDGYCVVENNVGPASPAESPPSLPPRRYSSLPRHHSLSDGEAPLSDSHLLKPVGVSTSQAVCSHFKASSCCM